MLKFFKTKSYVNVVFRVVMFFVVCFLIGSLGVGFVFGDNLKFLGPIFGIAFGFGVGRLGEWLDRHDLFFGQTETLAWFISGVLGLFLPILIMI